MDKELCILILENVPADAELEEHELRKAGLVFTSKVVNTREAFLKELDEFFPDLILSAYGVLSFDGLAALRIAQEKCPEVPFILVTGKLGEEFAIEQLKEGATDYVLKSNLKRLVPSVKRALEEAKLIKERKRAEEALLTSEAELHDNYFIQSAINVLLSESLENMTLEDILQKALNMILAVPWIAFESIGSISLVEDDADVLVMKAQSNIPEPLKELCVRVPFGKCLCGRAAQTQKLQFADHVDERHEICYEEMYPHGHYSVPILYGSSILGVLNIYLQEGHIRDKKEEDFLSTIADTLAGIIIRKKAEVALNKEKAFSDTVISSLPGIFYLFDENGRLLQWNRNLEIVSGYPSEEIEKMNPLDFFSGKEKKLVEEAIQEVFVKGDSNVEANLVSKDRRIIPYYFTGLRFLSENRPYLVGMGIDITKSKKAEEEIKKRVKELEEFYDMAVGRELRMKELKEHMEEMKEEMEKLKKELEKYKKP